MPRADRAYDIVDHAQLAAVTQPLRMEIVDLVAHHGPCSIGEVADLMGRARSTLYFHVDKLCEVGLLLAAGERGDGRAREALYRAPGVPVDIVFNSDDPIVVEATIRYASNILARAKRALTAAFASKRVTTDGPRRNAHIDQTSCWLDETQLAKMNQHLDAIRDIVATGPKRRHAELHLITVAISKLETK